MAELAIITCMLYYYEIVKPIQNEQESKGKETKGQIDYPESIGDKSWLN